MDRDLMVGDLSEPFEPTSEFLPLLSVWGNVGFELFRLKRPMTSGRCGQVEMKIADEFLQGGAGECVKDT